MRKNVARQLPLVPSRIDHVHARELVRMGEVLAKLPRAAALVTRDLLEGRSRSSGRPGMTGDQVLRCVLVMQLSKMTFRQLAFHLIDSNTYRSFCRFGIYDRVPAHSTLHENIKRLKPETLERINGMLLQHALESGVERADKVRVDSTVVESAIHYPNDSSLLYDSVRALTDRLDRAADLVEVCYSDHRKRAKRRALEIANAKNMSARMSPYRDLFKITVWTMDYAEQGVQALRRSTKVQAASLHDELNRYIGLAKRALDQAQRRVLGGESVPAEQKLVSIFEPHTDILIKDNRETHYGHKTFLTVGKSGMVLDLVVERGNPSDVTRAVTMVERHTKLFGKAPKQASFDGGFASRANLGAIKQLGVEDVAFAKRKGIAVEEMTSTDRVYRELRRFRAGVEAIISLLKRSFGFGRCTWRGYGSFRAYAWASVLSANLLMHARHTLD